MPSIEVRPLAGASRGPTHLTEDWHARQSTGPIEFELRWIPYLNDRDTSLDDLTKAWENDHEVAVGKVTFPKTDFDSTEGKLTELLASELGANPGNWLETPGSTGDALPATRFTAARQLSYRTSQAARGALTDDRYNSFFERGEIGAALAAELVRRYQQKRAAGHWVPNVGDLTVA